MRNKNKNDNSTIVVTSSTTSIMNSTNSNANRSNYVESDSEYETEEVYELSEWYPPDYWKSNNYYSDLRHIANSITSPEANATNHHHLDNKNDKKQICLTDVTVDNLTVTMFEGCSEQGFFKTL